VALPSTPGLTDEPRAAAPSGWVTTEHESKLALDAVAVVAGATDAGTDVDAVGGVVPALGVVLVGVLDALEDDPPQPASKVTASRPANHRRSLMGPLESDRTGRRGRG
jgi:hypothetical protein